MANTIGTGATKQFWIPGVQSNLDSMLVADKVATTSRKNDRVIYNPYNSQMAGADGAAATAYTVTDFTTDADSLTVNRRAVAAEHVDNIEELQASFALTQERMNEHSAIIAKKIDQFMLNLPVGFSGVSQLGNGGVVSATPYTSSNSVVDDIMNSIYEKLAINNAALEKGTFCVVSPYEMTDLKSFMQNNGFGVSDEAIKKGVNFRGTTFSGIDIYASNNLTHVAVLTLATNPTADDTVTIAGVTWTFKAAPAAAGEVDIGGDADASRVLLTAAVNNTNGYAAGAGAANAYYEVSAANRLILSRLQVVAVDSPGGNTMTVTCKGTFTVAETLTATADVWGTVRRYLVAGVYGSMFLALPSGGATFEKKAVSSKHGRELETSQVYNGTIWTRQVPQIVTMLVD